MFRGHPALNLGDEVRSFFPGLAAGCDYRNGGIIRRVNVHVRQQGDHADEARDGKDVDGGRGLFTDIDLLVCNVIHDCEGLNKVG